jgi:hypothetical protein
MAAPEVEFIGLLSVLGLPSWRFAAEGHGIFKARVSQFFGPLRLERNRLR